MDIPYPWKQMDTAPKCERILVYHCPRLYDHSYYPQLNKGVLKFPDDIYIAESFSPIIFPEIDGITEDIIFGSEICIFDPTFMEKSSNHYAILAPVCWTPIPDIPNFANSDISPWQEMNTAPKNKRILTYHCFGEFRGIPFDYPTKYSSLCINNKVKQLPVGVYITEYNKLEEGWLLSLPKAFNENITKNYYPIDAICWIPLPKF